MRFGSTAILGASILLAAGAAHAGEREVRIDIAVSELGQALAAFSAQTGISLAYDSALPRRTVQAVHGRMSPRAALDRLLRGTDLRAVRIGPRAFRIARAAPATEPVAAEPAPDEAIVVTGRRRTERLSQIPAPVAVYTPASWSRPGVATDSREVARQVDGLTSMNNGVGGDRVFIRGIADTPFNGFSQATTSVQLDEVRATFDAPEPGLRLVDVARVEVLKGPQGPLYGTGALGGVYRIVTNRPVPGSLAGAASLGVTSVTAGGPGVQGDVVINVPVWGEALSLRAVGYGATEGGWIDEPGGRHDVNRSRMWGGRLALRVEPLSGWSADLNGWTQSIRANGRGYVTSPSARVRPGQRDEPASGAFRGFQAVIRGAIGGQRLTIAGGLVRQAQDEVYDGSDAPQLPNAPAPVDYLGARTFEVLDGEIRLESPEGSRIGWVAGASYLRSRSSMMAWLLPEATHVPLTVTYGDRQVTEAALFADGSFSPVARVRLGLGVRAFSADVLATYRRTDIAFPDSAYRAETSFGVTPSASLSYAIAPDRLIYLRFSTAFRPGGLDPSNAATRRYGSDEVRALDLGMRFDLGGGLNLSGALFASDWRNVQADYLDANGAVATRNIGNAANVGAEMSVDWRPANGWRVQAGGTWQAPRLQSGADGIALSPNRRLPAVADVEARVSLSRDADIADWRITPTLSAQVIGASRLSTDPGTDRRIAGRLLGRLGVSGARGRLTLGLEIDNLLDSRADTLAYGNPYAARRTRQYTPVRPRTFALWASRRL